MRAAPATSPRRRLVAATGAAAAATAGAAAGAAAGAVAAALVAVNIFGGFLVTQRMLAMYKKKLK